ncbi:MAG: glycosyltransferase [Bacteroidaceae bacterium]
MLDYLSLTENQSTTIQMVDEIVYFIFLFIVLYFFIFCILSLAKSKSKYPTSPKKHKIAILIPAYNEDQKIIQTVQSFQEQSYDSTKFQLFIIDENLQQETLKELAAKNLTIIEHINYTAKNKINALRSFFEKIETAEDNYDIAILMSPGNCVDTNFLDKINDAFYAGCLVIQTHQIAQKRNTSIAVLSAVSEEINNSIFRKAHRRLGLSSALIGSGMAFEFDLLKELTYTTHTNSIIKDFERIILKKNIYIEYLNVVYTYEEKTNNNLVFYKERKQWVVAQLYGLLRGAFSLPKAFIQGNWDYCNKIIQWLVPPKTLLVTLLIFFCLLASFIDLPMAIKWWALLFSFVGLLVLSIPRYLLNMQLVKTLFKIPFVLLLTFFYFFIPVQKKGNR